MSDSNENKRAKFLTLEFNRAEDRWKALAAMVVYTLSVGGVSGSGYFRLNKWDSNDGARLTDIVDNNRSERIEADRELKISIQGNASEISNLSKNVYTKQTVNEKINDCRDTQKSIEKHDNRIEQTIRDISNRHDEDNRSLNQRIDKLPPKDLKAAIAANSLDLARLSIKLTHYGKEIENLKLEILRLSGAKRTK